MPGSGVELASAYVTILPSTRGLGAKLTAELQQPVGAASKAATRSVSGDFASLGKTAGAALAGIGIGMFVKDIAGAASDISESTNKVRVVFGQAAQGVIDFSEGSAKAMGMSQQAALEASGTFGNLFVSMGLAEKQSASMSTSLVGLAADLASFNNTSPQDALEALRSGLVGETEPLRRFGVNLNDASLQQKALAMGLVKTTGQVLPPAVKAQAAYALILEQTKTAQGDFARTSDGLANSQRILTAEWQDAKAKMGQAVVPALLTLTHVASTALTVFNGLPEPVRTVAVGIAGVGTAALIATPYIKTLNGAIAALGVTSIGTGIASAGETIALKAMYAAESVKLLGAAAFGTAGLIGILTGAGILAANAIERHNAKAREAAIADKDWSSAMLSASESADILARKTNTVTTLHQGFGASVKTAGAGQEGLNRAQRDGIIVCHGAAAATKDLTLSVEELAKARGNAAKAARAATDAEIGALNASQDVAAKQTALADAIKTYGKNSNQARIAELELLAARRASGDANRKLADQQHAANEAFVRGEFGVKKLSGANRTLAHELNVATDRVSSLRGQLDKVPKEKRAKIEAQVAAAERNVDAIKKRIGSIKDKTVNVHIKFNGAGNVVESNTGRRIEQFIVSNAYGGYWPAKPGGYLSTIAERGVGEFAIPDEPTPRSMALVAQAARSIFRIPKAVAPGGSPSIVNHITGLEMNPDTIEQAVKRGMFAAVGAPAYL